MVDSELVQSDSINGHRRRYDALYAHENFELADEDGIVPLCAWAAHSSWTGLAGCATLDARGGGSRW